MTVLGIEEKTTADPSASLRDDNKKTNTCKRIADPHDLVLEEVFCEEEDVGGAFGEAAHEVGVPFRAEGDIDADAVALGGEAALEIAADAVEHLELEGVFVDFVLVDEVAHLIHDRLVMGSDAAE